MPECSSPACGWTRPYLETFAAPARQADAPVVNLQSRGPLRYGFFRSRTSPVCHPGPCSVAMTPRSRFPCVSDRSRCRIVTVLCQHTQVPLTSLEMALPLVLPSGEVGRSSQPTAHLCILETLSQNRISVDRGPKQKPVPELLQPATCEVRSWFIGSEYRRRSPGCEEDSRGPRRVLAKSPGSSRQSAKCPRRDIVRKVRLRDTQPNTSSCAHPREDLRY